MRFVGVIPARGGSERVKLKNFVPIGGQSLVQRAVNTAISASLRTVVTTDAVEIARAQVGTLAEVISRPRQLSGSGTPMEPVLRHVATALELEDADVMILLQPTSPLRTSASLREFVRWYEGTAKLVSAFSVTEDYGDYYASMEDRSLLRIRDQLPSSFSSRRSNSRNPLLRENGLYYAIPVQYIRNHKEIASRESLPYVTPASEDLDIDTMNDLTRYARLLEE